MHAMATTVDIERWKKKRKRTVVIFTIQTLFLGFEYSVNFLTLWLYIKNLVKPKAPKVYYGFISVAYLIGGLMCNSVTSRIVDRYRCVRLTIFICNTAVIVGNIIYALPFSPWLLLVGRFISGCGVLLKSVMSGEIARCYPAEDISSKLSLMGMAYCLGFIVGPGISILFENTNILIGRWHIVYENMPGLYMATLFMFIQALSYFFVYDLSKEYDLKAGDEAKWCEKDVSLDSNSNTNVMETCSISSEEHLLMDNNNENTCSVLKKLFRNFDIVLIFILSFFTKYLIITFDIWLPLLVIDRMHWSVTELNVIVLAGGVAMTISLLTFACTKPSDKLIYILGVWSTTFLVALVSVFIVLSYHHTSLPLNIIMWIMFCIGFSMVTLNDDIFFVSCLAKMVPSEIQSFSESIRLSMANTGALLAFITSALIFDWVLYVGICYIILIIMSIMLIIYRREVLCAPYVAIFYRNDYM